MFLGIKFEHRNETITMSQSHYLENILKTFGFNDCRPRTTPCEHNINSYAESTHPIYDNHQYRQMVGSLIYTMTCTSPDLSLAVTKLSQHLSCPDAADCAMLKHVFQYVKKTVDHKLTYRKSSNSLRIDSFSDADPWKTVVVSPDTTSVLTLKDLLLAGSPRSSRLSLCQSIFFLHFKSTSIMANSTVIARYRVQYGARKIITKKLELEKYISYCTRF